ncbi:unnamed protein product [Paramecium sonneborni]|uniref:Uncharacterized protein n=1 Tax=Paramecium sonneborni TaxID=65129 RepID=A0A8S1PIE2_9CILI|nr:unnamed protein product [Paramecium sonneborni]
MNPIEIYQNMVKQDAVFVNNHIQNSFSIFKQSVTHPRNISNNKVNQIQESFTSRPQNYVPQYQFKQQSYRKVEEWQKKQDLLVKFSYQQNHFIPNYPQKIQTDLSLRVQRHYDQNKSVDQVQKNNKFQHQVQKDYQDNQAYIIPQINLSTQNVNLKTESLEQSIVQIKTKNEEVKKKSNLKRVKNQTVEKKTVKIEDIKKSNSKSPENQSQSINKPPLQKMKNEKQQEQNSSLEQKPSIETVDQFLQKAK